MSIKKSYSKKQSTCKVTFSLPKTIEAKNIALLGDFNNWDSKATPMSLSRGSYKAEVELEKGSEYQFRYLIDGTRWENDEEADKWVVSPFGAENSVVTI
ncbi:MAG: isoamylase early set domain-containing protein [Sphingobacteriales bacterium]|nr:isoamylase early set domain-containing protein [Sphingobacteriales bacterium]